MTRPPRQMEPAWLIDGEQNAGLPPDDRGLAYGDGLFETIAAPGGRMRRFEQHYARLCDSCARLGFAPPQREQIESDINQLAPQGLDHVVKLIVSRGSGGRGYCPPTETTPRRLVGVFPWPDYPRKNYRDGVRVIRCTTRLGENPALAGLKHLGRLEQVLGQQEVAATHADEGVMRAFSGQLISGTMSNIFLVVDSVLLTPAIVRCGIAGVMRGAIMEVARELGIEVVETELMPDVLDTADEVFLSNSVIGIWPVSVLENIAFSVGSLTQSLMRQLEIYPS